MNTQYTEILEICLGDFERWLAENANWRGKEHDCVNAFAHGFLMPRCLQEIASFSPACIGIEVGVPQPEGIGIRRSVRRDLVIWQEPFTTTWDSNWTATSLPAVIVEWKARRLRRPKPELDKKDLSWLGALTEQHPKVVGFAVTVDFTASPTRLLTAKIEKGRLLRDVHNT
jgi:hypothetical protein